jgi:hypothetical protein
MGISKTAHDRIFRYAGGFERHFSQISALSVGIPHLSQNGSLSRGTRSWQSGHQRHPSFPQPPHIGGKSKSSPFQVNR